jgi:hypothetical protein
MRPTYEYFLLETRELDHAKRQDEADRLGREGWLMCGNTPTSLWFFRHVQPEKQERAPGDLPPGLFLGVNDEPNPE